MKSGQEKKLKPHEVGLKKYQSGRARSVRDGYVILGSGQIIREDTLNRWRAEGRIQ